MLNEIHKLRQKVIGLEMGIIKLTHGDKVCHRMSDELAQMILIEGGILVDSEYSNPLGDKNEKL